MAWCHQATSHYLIQCWPRSLSPYDVTRPQWVKCFAPSNSSNCSFVLYNDVMMSIMVCKITGISIVCSKVYSRADKKTSKLRVTGLCEGNQLVTGGFSSQREGLWSGKCFHLMTSCNSAACAITCITAPPRYFCEPLCRECSYLDISIFKRTAQILLPWRHESVCTKFTNHIQELGTEADEIVGQAELTIFPCFTAW